MAEDLMRMIAGQIAAGQQKKFPRVNREAKGDSKQYYDKLGVDMGDKWAAGQAMQKAQTVYRQGGAMPAALAKLVEMSRGSTKTTPQLPSQVPAAFTAREAGRLGRGTGGGKTEQSRPPGAGAAPPPGYKPPMGPQSAAPPDKAMAMAEEAVQGGPTQFKGTKAPMQEDIDMVLNSAGKDRSAMYDAFVQRFGEDAATNFLDGDD